MLDQSFNAKNFLRLINRADFANKNYALDDDKEKLLERLEEVQKNFEEGLIDFNKVQTQRIKNKTVFSINDLGLELAIRKLNDNLKRLYQVKQANREQIVKQVLSLSSDGTPISILRKDISSFYESISKDKLLFKVLDDYLLSHDSKEVLSSFFNNDIFPSLGGVPRGISISATLSELYLRDLDDDIRQLPSVFYYARYVDDMVIFSYDFPVATSQAVDQIIENKELSLNVSKSQAPISLPARSKNLCLCEKACKCGQSLDFLGYNISFPKPIADQRRKRNVVVSISKNKIKKIKTRIIRAFLDYIDNSDFELLEKRVRFLTANYPLPSKSSHRRLRGGIYYNYPLLNELSVLDDLDKFLRKIIFGKKGSLCSRLYFMLSNNQRDKLKKFSFKHGWEKKIFYRFKKEEMRKIKNCWKYE